MTLEAEALTVETSAADASTPSHRLHSMFAPRSIAIVGASDNSGWSRSTVGNLRATGYGGELHLVNRRGVDVHGEPTVASLLDLPHPVDLGYVLTGPGSLPQMIEDAAEAGIHNLAIIAAGFGETGPEGFAFERRLVDMALERDIVLLGPNNLGFINLTDGIAPWSQKMPWPLTSGGVGFLSQSGALGIFLLNYLEQRDIGLSHLLTLGNEAMVTVAEGMDYLIEQPDTRVIAMYMESVRHPEAFLAAADRAMAAGKPVVVYKAGRGEVGAKVTAAHTGALAGDDKVFDAVFRQHGIIRADTIEDLVTTVGILDAYGVLPGERVGFVTASGAMCGVISDAAEAVGMSVPEFAPETVLALREGGLPDFATPQNPLDVTGYVVIDWTMYPRSQRTVTNDPNVDIVVLHGTPAQSEQAATMMKPSTDEVLKIIADSPVPVIPMDFLASDRTPFGRAHRRELGMPHIVDSLSRGIPALQHAIEWSSLQRAKRVRSGPQDVAVELKLHDESRRGVWSETRSRDLLEANGVPFVPARTAHAPDDAVAAAEEFGYPVVLKTAADGLAHKSDIGGVVLNVRGPDEVRSAYAGIVRSVGRHVPAAAQAGVLVSPMRSSGTELVVGVVRDPTWGLTMAIGLGGIWVEIFQDAALRHLPASREDVERALAELKAFPLLTGARGGEIVDLRRLAEAIERIGAVATALGGDLAELEVNPLLVSGDRIEALDALIRWTEDDSGADQ